MPQITSPDFLDGELLIQLSTYRFNQSAHTGEFLNRLFGQKITTSIGFTILGVSKFVNTYVRCVPEIEQNAILLHRDRITVRMRFISRNLYAYLPRRHPTGHAWILPFTPAWVTLGC
ncbi:MAG: hypothetical protein DDT32_02032 [Syntrophomonadaceae bacterium]|nr:hypothetical protein [Bacillota bacterium]